MSRTAVIIPFKSHGAKSRLAGVATSQEREDLALALLESVLGVLRASGLIGSTLVVTSHAAGRDLAAASGARVVRETTDEGVNQAVSHGLDAARGFDEVLVLPSDLPMFKRTDLLHLVRMRRSGLDAVIAPSRSFDGTNAYFFSRGERVPLLYDRDSFWGHLKGLALNGLAVGVCTRPGLSFDVDTADDLMALARSRSKSAPARLARSLLR